MNKKKRHDVIKRLIQSHHIGTQEDIKKQLHLEGIDVTQATLSRDLREIGLVKLRDQQGRLYYSLSDMEVTSFSLAARAYIKKVARAGFMLVLHTNLGEADVLANVIDAQGMSEVLGTIAGADTLLVICQDEETARIYEKDLSL